MKYFIVISLTLSLFGCGPGDSSDDNTNNLDVKSLDLTGTWRMVNEKRTIKADTGEYLYSTFIELKYVLEDTDNGVKYNRCWEYGDFHSSYGVKTENHFYMNVQETGFTAQDKDTLKRTTTYENEWDPGFTFESIKTLTRISDDVNIDSGTLILNGPVTAEEYNQVCTWKVTSNLGESETLELIAPYNDDQISFRFDLLQDIAAGSYYYDDYWDSEEISLSINSNADTFWSTLNTNNIQAEEVTINIIESTDIKLSGTFSFVDEDDQNYSGEFEIFLDN